MARKQAKTTQLPTDMMPLWHKSPTTTGNNQEMSKAATMTPLMKQTPMTVQSDKTSTAQDKDKEMPNDASMAMQQIMNASTMDAAPTPNNKKKQQTHKTIFNLCKMVLAVKMANDT